ncbi:MAG: S-layer homology domain-containing protein [Oscillospiraceae bacterium]|nr:S-layer homology domain-containing protein [Oscillospiraceae bacterium]
MKIGKTAKRFLSAILMTALLAGILPLTEAKAAGSFSDISETDYYYAEVSAMYSQGMINGYGDGTFLPDNPVKNCEALKLVCSMAGVDCEGYSGKTDPWYSDVFSWAKDNGITASGTDPDAYATREQLGAYIVAVYKLSTATSTDVFSDTDSKTANTLYDYGVVKGVPAADGTVSFEGNRNVKRSDTCVMLYRLSLEVTKPNWIVLTKGHYNVERPASFRTYDDFINAWKYMLVNVKLKDSFQIKGVFTKFQLDECFDDVLDAYYFAIFDYLEYASFLNRWEVGVSYTVSGGKYSDPTFTLSLSSSESSSALETVSRIRDFESACAQIVTSLYGGGSLSSGMTDKQKAHVLFVYTAYNTKYDTSESLYSGYDAAVKGTAVCQGYAAMYAYICNLAGVRMESMTGSVDGVGHAWNRIYSEGKYYNIDATWADPVPDRANYCDEDWFWLTDSYLKTCDDSRTFDCDTLVYG